MRLILHIGTAKTGTSSLQSALHANSGWLRRRGIYYPAPPDNRDGHHAVARALRDGAEGATTYLQKVRHEAEPSDSVLLSAEPFYRHIVDTDDTWSAIDYWDRRSEYVDRVREAFSDFEVEVVVYLRPHASAAESLYKEAAATGTFGGSFEEFLSDRRVFFDYSSQIDVWRHSFEQVTVRRYDHDVVSDFFTYVLGIEQPPVSAPRERTSFDPRLAYWILGMPTNERLLQRRFALDQGRFWLDESGSNTGFWRDGSQQEEFVLQFGGEYGPRYFGEKLTPRVRPTARLSETERIALTEAYDKWATWERFKLRARKTKQRALALFSP
jgi:hypothetical protein